MTRAPSVPETVTIHVPFRLVKRGGRKEMHLPDGVRPDRKADNTLIKALTRAFRWKRMLESGEFATIADLAEREWIAPSYMTRILRLTLIAPHIIEGILDGKQGPEATLAQLLEVTPTEWSPKGWTDRKRPKADDWPCLSRRRCVSGLSLSPLGRTTRPGPGTLDVRRRHQ